MHQNPQITVFPQIKVFGSNRKSAFCTSVNRKLINLLNNQTIKEENSPVKNKTSLTGKKLIIPVTLHDADQTRFNVIN